MSGVSKSSERPEPRTNTMEAKAYQELRRSIMQGVFSPGETVSLRALASSLGTSVTPVRAALNRLSAEHACEQGNNRNFRIPSMTPERLEEVCYWRKELEGQAALLATPVMTQSDLDRMVKLNEQLKKNVEAGDWSEVLNLNFEFHFTIYRAAPSEILVPMIEGLWLQMGPITHKSLPSRRLVWNSEQHLKMLDALNDKDAKEVAKCMRKDIDSMYNFLKDDAFPKKQQVRSISG